MVHFTSLKTLTIEGSSLSSIPVLNYLPKLQKLFLNNNNITDVSPMAFASLTALEVSFLFLHRHKLLEWRQF